MIHIFFGAGLMWLAAVVLFTFTNTLQGESLLKGFCFAMIMATTFLTVITLIASSLFFLWQGVF